MISLIFLIHSRKLKDISVNLLLEFTNLCLLRTNDIRLKKAHKTFVKHIINYFKVTDRADLLQEEHINKLETIPEVECENQLPIDTSIEEANQCIMRTSLQPVATMDQFVNIRKVKIEQPDPPRRKKIDIKTEEHKKKGIKKKKDKKIEKKKR